MNKQYFLGLLRLSLGWIFFWAFIDKVFGLGFATCRNSDTGAIEFLCSKAWLSGGSPTTGFLKFATRGPFAEFFQSFAGSPVVDWLFMLGLFFVGTTLLLGILVRLGSYTGTSMVILMYLAAFIFPENNPILDEHIIYAVSFLLLAHSYSGEKFGLGSFWKRLHIVRQHPILE